MKTIISILTIIIKIKKAKIFFFKIIINKNNLIQHNYLNKSNLNIQNFNKSNDNKNQFKEYNTNNNKPKYINITHLNEELTKINNQ